MRRTEVLAMLPLTCKRVDTFICPVIDKPANGISVRQSLNHLNLNVFAPFSLIIRKSVTDIVTLPNLEVSSDKIEPIPFASLSPVLLTSFLYV